MDKICFFIYGEYYLLPEEYKTFKDFSEFVKEKTKKGKSLKIKVRRLNDEKTLAPYFVDKNIVDEIINIENADDLFEAKIFLLTQTEYNEKLREIVKNFCNGCVRFNGDVDDTDESLEGHHEEICLNGLCVFREHEKSNRYHLYNGLKYNFLKSFKEKQSKIETLMNKKNDTLAVDAMKFLLENILGERPLAIILEKKRNRYYCYLPSCLEEIYSNIYSYLCNFMNKHIENWTFVPFLPKGLLNKNKYKLPKIRFLLNNERRLEYIHIVVDNFDNVVNYYLALCNEIGEDAFLTAYNTIGIKFETRELGFEVSLDFLKEDIKKRLKLRNIKKEIPFPVISELYLEDINTKAQIKKAIETSNIFFHLNTQNESIYSEENKSKLRTFILEDYGISIGRLSIECNGFENIKFMLKNLQKVCYSDFSFMFACEYSKDMIDIYLFVAEKAHFLSLLRKFTPILQKYNAKIKLFDEEKSSQYKIDYDLSEEEKKNIRIFY